jgi:solute carrier family 25 citrate transporter 1
MSFVSGFRHILATEGVAGVYQGAAATALKQGSNQGLRFMWFNEYKRIITNDGEKPLTPLMGLFGGMSAGCFSTIGNNREYNTLLYNSMLISGYLTLFYFLSSAL